MNNKIIEVLNAQCDLIKPHIKNGTTHNIRIEAEKEHKKILDVGLELSNSGYSEKESNAIIIKNVDLIVDCFSSIYSKLGDDSRSLPTPYLRDLAKVEMKSIMNVWENLPTK